VEHLHAAIAAHLRRQRSELPRRRRTDPPPARVREVAIYARVATASPGASADLDAQVAACTAFASGHDEAIALTYREVAAGATLDRPRLADLRTFIAHGWITAVLVTTSDRLTHDPMLLGALRAEWNVLGVAIIAVMGQG